MTDNTQTTRTFQCRETLWSGFEQMARELECSVDYLLNDAMKQYVRQRGYNVGGDVPAPSAPPPSLRPSNTGRLPLPPVPSAVPAQAAPPTGQYYPPAAPVPPPGSTPMRRPPPAPLPPPPAARPPMAQVAPQPMAPPAQYMPAPQPGFAPQPSAMPMAPAPMPVQPMPAQPPAPAPAPPMAHPGGGRPQVNIYYMGERYSVTKDRFIIGRGRQSSDLTIKDPNVSRQHAMIEYLNGYYYIVDMGSTNGVEHDGQRIQRCVVNEGDTFRVCDHELRFSYY